MVPLLGAIAEGHCPSTLITPKLFFAIWGLCWYNFSLSTSSTLVLFQFFVFRSCTFILLYFSLILFFFDPTFPVIYCSLTVLFFNSSGS